MASSSNNARAAIFTISSGSFDVEPSTSAMTSSVSEGGHLTRQVTFCVGVQTDISQSDSTFNPLTPGVNILHSNPVPVGAEHSTIYQAITSNRDVITRPSTSDNQRQTRWQRILHNLDCTTFCYLAIAGLMIGVGILITTVTAREKVINDDSNGSAQLWIVGPIFISSGILVCIKAATHVCKRINQSSSATVENGNLLRQDTRASLRAVPPSYSKALIAPVPSFVVEVEERDDKFPQDTLYQSGNNESDTESLNLVTVTCDPTPPTYAEAIEEMQKRFSLSCAKRISTVRDAATQIDFIESRNSSKNTISSSNENANETRPAESSREA